MTQATPASAVTTTDMIRMAARFVNSTSAHIFLTGKAGTGKTTFLRGLRSATHKTFAVVAPTGIAALNAGGVTIHSQFLLPLGMFIPVKDLPDRLQGGENVYTQDTLARKHPLNSARKQVLRSLDLLVIDEVSMLRADLLDAIDYRLKAARNNFSQPFGGVQLLLIGDLFQLPPVVRGNESVLFQYYGSAWFYESKALQQAGFVYIELDKIFRQQDDAFIRLLNNLRNNTVAQDDIDELNKYVRSREEIESLREVITLTTHNYKADDMNRSALQKLKTEARFFEAIIEGEFPESIYPVQSRLELKEGAQIMFVRNDNEGQAYFNGKLATVSRITQGKVEVIMAGTHDVYELKRERWENKRYTIDAETRDLESEVIGSFEQYPIKLAWAITVHKSQGLTFDKAIIDVAQAFADGQVYVALSRLRSLDGLILRERVNPSVISTDKSVVSFQTQHHKPSSLEEVMKESQRAFLAQVLERTFNFESLVRQLYYIQKGMSETAAKVVTSSVPVLDNILKNLLDEKTNTARYRSQLQGLLNSQQLPELQERIQKGSDYYSNLMWKNIGMLLQHIAEMQQHKRIKSYINSLDELDQLIMKKLQEIEKMPLLAQSVLGERDEYTFDTLIQAQQERRMQMLRDYSVTAADPKPGKGKGSRKKKGEPKESTVDITLSMFSLGKTVHEIAKERGLTVGTIEGHLAQAVVAGLIDISKVMTKDELEEIIQVVSTMPEGYGNKELYDMLKGKYSYGKLRAARAFIEVG